MKVIVDTQEFDVKHREVKFELKELFHSAGTQLKWLKCDSGVGVNKKILAHAANYGKMLTILYKGEYYSVEAKKALFWCIEHESVWKAGTIEVFVIPFLMFHEKKRNLGEWLEI